MTRITRRALNNHHFLLLFFAILPCQVVVVQASLNDFVCRLLFCNWVYLPCDARPLCDGLDCCPHDPIDEGDTLFACPYKASGQGDFNVDIELEQSSGTFQVSYEMEESPLNPWSVEVLYRHSDMVFSILMVDQYAENATATDSKNVDCGSPSFTETSITVKVEGENWNITVSCPL